MRKRRLVHVLTSAVLTMAMVASMGMTALAATLNTSTSVPVAKTVTTDGNTYAPNETFTFAVSTGTATTISNDGVNTNVAVAAGVSGGLTGTTITFAADTTNETKSSYPGSGNLTVDLSKFSEPGVYHYTLTETPGSNSAIVYDGTTYDVYVYIVKNSSSGKLEVLGVIAYEEGETTKADSLAFTNNYGDDSGNDPTDPSNPEPEDKNDSTHDLTISKTISGDMADSTKTFTFTIEVAAGTNGNTHEVVIVGGTNVTVTSGSVNSTTDGYKGYIAATDTITVSLKGGESLTIYGLLEDDTVTVTESDYSSDGYSTSVSTDGVTTTSASTSLVQEVTVTDDGAKVAYTNTRSSSGVPTGVILSFAPYVLLVAFAGVFAVMFLGKKREEY